MNLKKTAITLAAAGAMLASAIPAFASSNCHDNRCHQPVLGTNQSAYVNNDAWSASNTGANIVDNDQMNMGKTVKAGDTSTSIKTGDAWAMSEAVAYTNNAKDRPYCCEYRGRRNQNCACDAVVQKAMVNNTAVALSNSGMNMVDNDQFNFAPYSSCGEGRCRVRHYTGVMGGKTTTNITTGHAGAESYAWTYTNYSVK